MDLYNVMVFYEGEGSTNIYIPGNGDTTITYGRPVYVKNANFNVIEALRSFRKMQISIKIGVSSVGAYRTIDLGTQPHFVKSVPIKEKEQVTNADISSILGSATNGPIVIDNKEEDKTTDYGSYVLPSGKFAGKTLAEIDKEGKLKAVYNGYKTRNKEIKEAIEKYYNSQISK